MKRASLLLALSLLQPLVSLDQEVRDRVQHFRRPALERPMHWLTDCGYPAVVLAGLAAIAFIDEAAGLTTARAALVALVPVNLVVEGLKSAVDRPRPDGDRRRRNSSFPSSHAANAMTLAWMLSRRWPRGRLPCFGLAGLIAFSRMYLDRHFFTDVVVGSVIGIGFAMLTVRIFPALDPRRPTPSSSARPESRIGVVEPSPDC